MAQYLQKYKRWLSLVKDESLLKELKDIEGNAEEIENRFYKDLEFGTGGLRGVLGAGSNYLNIYTIIKATQGLALYLKSIGGTSACIGYDSRINSLLFARTAAAVLAHNGIKAYICKELMPTPFLSYAVRKYRADAGVMVTASHNPAKYNGYKVYGSDGCQMTDAFADKVIGFISGVDPFAVQLKEFEHYLNVGGIEYMTDKIESDYVSKVIGQSGGNLGGISIVYSPLNGTGYRIVPEVLRRCGAEQLSIVKEQAQPDGRFPTCPYPNPEKIEALRLGLKKAADTCADILLATDPDADRVGIAVREESGDYTLISGNEAGVLLTDYLLARKAREGSLDKRPVVIKTIVTSSLADKVATQYGAEVRDVLTGFKYIGEMIGELEKAGEEQRFVLGFEESYGYLAGSYVRDKDAVVASLLLCEMTAHYKKQGKTLTNRLEEIYAKFGRYSHKTLAEEFPGASGNKKMQELLNSLRSATLKDIGGLKVLSCTDYLDGDTGLPKADVISYKLEGGAQLIVRPSGTEPLIKFYLTAALDEKQNAAVFAALEGFINSFFGKC